MKTGEVPATADPLVLLGTSRQWFSAAIHAVLKEESYRIVRAEVDEEVLRLAEEESPELVILDEGIPPGGAAELVGKLVDVALPPHVPILIYNSGYTDAEEVVRALEAGAWGSISEPLRTRELVASLGRYLELGRWMAARPGRSTDDGGRDGDTGVLSLPGLLDTLPVFTSLAERRDSALTCIVMGPTKVAEGADHRELRRRTARFCSSNVRASDLCGWVEGVDVVIAAYDTSREQAIALARRLRDLAESGRGEPPATGRSALSFGIAELAPEDRMPTRELPDRRPWLGRGGDGERMRTLYTLAAAQTALERAREAGGGIEITEVD